MGFNQHKPVLEVRTQPQKQSRVGVRCGPLLQTHRLLNVAMHDHSFLLLGLLCSLGCFSRNLLDLYRLDDTDSNGLPHVTHGETT